VSLILYIIIIISVYFIFKKKGILSGSSTQEATKTDKNLAVVLLSINNWSQKLKRLRYETG
jgi:hypothetical protein